MPKLHIFKIELDLDPDELKEIGIQIQKAIRSQGRPKDKVIVVAYADYLTSYDLEED